MFSEYSGRHQSLSTSMDTLGALDGLSVGREGSAKPGSGRWSTGLFGSFREWNDMSRVSARPRLLPALTNESDSFAVPEVEVVGIGPA